MTHPAVLKLATVLAAAAEPATPHGAASGGGGLPQFDAASFPGQIFWLAVTFGLLYVVMQQSILPRLGGVIEERRDRIADDLDKAAEFRRQAADAEGAYNKGLADARAKAQGIAAETRAAIDAELAEQQADADARAAESVSAAERRIEDMKAKAQAKVREAAVETTKAIVETLIDERPADEAILAAMPRA